MPELYPDTVEGPYTVPSGTDIADGPQAFRDFADSLGGLSDTLEVFDLAGDHTVSAVEMGGLFTHSGTGMTLTVDSGVHPVGSVMAVSNLSDLADAVVTVETPNLTEAVGQYAIMSFTQVQVDVWVPNGGGAGGDEPKDPTAPPDPGVFDEAASTGATFYTMIDPDGSGYTYRVAEFLDHGTLVLSEGGAIDSWMGASGNSGGGSGASAIFGSGGNYGGIQELFNVVAQGGAFDVHVGSVYGQTYKSDSSRITGPFRGFKQIVCGTHQWAQGSTYAYRGYSEAIHQVDWDSPPTAYYTVGTAGGGAQPGRPGYGGNGSGGSGGAPGPVLGWTESPFMWGRGGGGSYTVTPEPPNTGNGGHGSQWSSYQEGGSGRVYIRVRVED